MTTETHVVWTNELVEASNYTINDNEEVHLLASSEIDNSSGTVYNSLKCTIEYSGLTPDVTGVNWSIGAIVEAKDPNGNWYPIAYQFTPLKNKSQGLKRILYVQPDMDTINVGIDDIVYPVDKAVARISREQGVVPESVVRVCILLVDKDTANANAFNSVTVNAEVELYNV